MFLSATVALFQLLTLVPAHAEDPSDTKWTSDEQRIIQKAKDEIMRELLDGDFLRDQIQLGIQDYIRKQQEAQAAFKSEQARFANEKVKSVRRVSAARDHIYGNPNAPISLIEYSDYECPFCKNFHQTAKQLVKAYDGKVNWVYRHFPLKFHNPGAQKEAEASECVYELGGNNAFWRYTDAVYERTKSNGNGFPLIQLVPLAIELGLDEKQFAQCYESGRYAIRVKEDLDEASKIGITGTPANILLNNQSGQVVSIMGAQPFEAFKAEIEKLLIVK
jgi:protein-disulfide isomerase